MITGLGHDSKQNPFYKVFAYNNNHKFFKGELIDFVNVKIHLFTS